MVCQQNNEILSGDGQNKRVSRARGTFSLLQSKFMAHVYESKIASEWSPSWCTCIVTQIRVQHTGMTLWRWASENRNPTGKRLIFRLILPNFLPNMVKSITSSQSRFFILGDALRDRPATPEAGTFVSNSRRHGGAVAICKKRQVRGGEIRRKFGNCLIIRQPPNYQELGSCLIIRQPPNN